MIELKNVTKSYNRGEIKAVEELNLTVGAGEIFGFLGPNGAGKTTTIKMIVGLLKPDQGQCLVKGLDIQKKPLEVKKNIGFVPDRPEVYEKLTGIEYLNFIADIYDVPSQQRIEWGGYLLEKFQLTHALKDLIQSYSHGMRQKIILIGALMHKPDVIIMDEPMVGLDPKSAHEMKELMRQFATAGKTIFFSTHILEVAEQFCHTIGIIHNGKLIGCGTLAQLQAQAKNKATLEKLFLEMTQS